MLKGTKRPLNIFSEHFWSRVAKSDGCWLWDKPNAVGYGVVCFQGKQRTAHRVSWYLHTGEWAAEYVCHKCNNKLCVRPDHLYAGTPKQNTRDCINSGLFRPGVSKGENNGSSKLSYSEVSDILKRYSPKIVTRKQLAQEYGIHKSIVDRIIAGTAWREVPR